jgi:hypothetical protein
MSGSQVRFSVQVIRRGSALGQPSSLLPPQQSSSVSQAKRHWFKSPLMNPPPLPPLPVVEAPELPPEPEEVELEPSLVLGFPEALLFVDAVAPLPPEPEAFAVLVLLAAELASSPSASVVLLPQATSEASAQADPRIQVVCQLCHPCCVDCLEKRGALCMARPSCRRRATRKTLGLLPIVSLLAIWKLVAPAPREHDHAHGGLSSAGRQKSCHGNHPGTS